MLQTYFKIFVRTLSRQKVYSTITVAGLALGLACFLLLSLFVLDELGYDNFSANADNIYRVLVYMHLNGIDGNNSKTSAPVGETLKKDFPEVLDFTRLGYFGQHNLRFADKVFRENDIYTADQNYLEFFSMPLIAGDPKRALSNPNSIVISESAAHKYFGDENPLGKIFAVDDSGTYFITGVMRDFPKKSHFSCNFLLSMSTYSAPSENKWLEVGYSTYLLLRPGTDINLLNEKMKKTAEVHIGPLVSTILGLSYQEFLQAGNYYNYRLQPLRSIYLRSQSDFGIDPNTEWGNTKLSNITYSYIFMAIGGFILLIAVFNFMNLATAKSENRAREVGIRKTLGSDRLTLITQFLAESIFTCLIAVALAVVIVQFALPSFNQFVNREISFDLFQDVYTIPLLLLFTGVVGLLAGSYPAFYLSSFQSSHILKSGTGGRSRKSRMRSVLVILQFVISIALIICTILIRQQLSFIQAANLGFNKDQLLVINNASVVRENQASFQDELSKNADIVSSTASSLMFASGIPGTGYLYDHATGSDIITAQFLDVDYDFAGTYQLNVLKGRFFSKDFPSDSGAVVINEAMLKELPDENPIGKNLWAVNSSVIEMKPFRIIGVLKNFNFESMHQTIRPLALHLSQVNQASTLLAIRVHTNDVSHTIQAINDVWQRFAGKEQMNWSFLSDNLAYMYRNDQKISEIFSIFTFLAIAIACMGLLGLVSYVTEQRTKEIGVRKVLGASVHEIILLISKDFIKWIVMANLIACPIAFILMDNWLKNFAYRITISWVVFAAAGFLALLIALVTISFLVGKVALRNPVTSLKCE